MEPYLKTLNDGTLRSMERIVEDRLVANPGDEKDLKTLAEIQEIKKNRLGAAAQATPEAEVLIAGKTWKVAEESVRSGR